MNEPTKLLAKLEHPNAVYSVAFSRDGKSLVSGSLDNTIKLWDWPSGQERARLRGHGDGVCGVAFSPEGKIFSASLDRSLKIWDAAGALEATLAGHQNYIECFAASTDGKWLASGGYDNEVRIWSVEERSTRYVLRGHSDAVYGVAFRNAPADPAKSNSAKSDLPKSDLPKSDLLASCGNDNALLLWDVESGKQLASVKGHVGAVQCVAFSPSGELLASGGSDQTVRLWDVDKARGGTGGGAASGVERAALEGHSQPVKCIVFSPDGKTLVSGGVDGTIRFWDGRIGARLFDFRAHANSVYGLAFSPDGGLLASASFDRTIKIWKCSPLAPP